MHYHNRPVFVRGSSRPVYRVQHMRGGSLASSLVQGGLKFLKSKFNTGKVQDGLKWIGSKLFNVGQKALASAGEALAENKDKIQAEVVKTASDFVKEKTATLINDLKKSGSVSEAVGEVRKHIETLPQEVKNVSNVALTSGNAAGKRVAKRVAKGAATSIAAETNLSERHASILSNLMAGSGARGKFRGKSRIGMGIKFI